MIEIWRGRVLWRGYAYSHNHPHIQLKKSGIPHTHTHTQSMQGFPVKTETGSGNTHGDGFICHLSYVEMANKPVTMGIARTRPRFDGESPHWLGMGMSMGNPRLFQLGMGMGMGMYISPPYFRPCLNYSNIHN